MATAAPHTVVSVLGRVVVGQGGAGVAGRAGHGGRQGRFVRSGSLAVGRTWMPVVRADVTPCGRPRRQYVASHAAVIDSGDVEDLVALVRSKAMGCRAIRNGC